MATISRRQLAAYAADQLVEGRPVSKLAGQLASVLLNSKRQNQAELLARDVAWELEHRGKIARARVTAAHSLSLELRKLLAEQVKNFASVDRVIIDEELDPSVIGGVRIETASHSWDKTLRRKLIEIREIS